MEEKNDIRNKSDSAERVKAVYNIYGLSWNEFSEITQMPINTLMVYCDGKRIAPEYKIRYIERIANLYFRTNNNNADVIRDMTLDEMTVFFQSVADAAFNAKGDNKKIVPTEYRNIDKFIKDIQLVTPITIKNRKASKLIEQYTYKTDVETHIQIKEYFRFLKEHYGKFKKFDVFTYERLSELTAIPMRTLINWVNSDKEKYEEDLKRNVKTPHRYVNPPQYLIGYIKDIVDEYVYQPETNYDVIRTLPNDKLAEFIIFLKNIYLRSNGNKNKIANPYLDIKEYLKNTQLVKIEDINLYKINPHKK